MIYLQLFLSFAYVGILTLGGGYASLPFIESQVVDVHGWLTMAEFTDLITISQITPGPIVINAATFVGTKVAGFGGAVCATLGFTTPPFIVVSIFFMIYRKYKKMSVMKGAMSALRPTVIALIASAGLGILITAIWGEASPTFESFNLISFFMVILAFLAIKLIKINQIAVIFLSGLIFLLVDLARNF